MRIKNVTLLAVGLCVVAVFALAGCTGTGNDGPGNNPPPSGSVTDMSPTIQAITGALTQAQAQSPVGPTTFTWSTAGNTAVLTLQGVLIANSGVGTWGTLVFADYTDTASGNTINGTLQVQVFQPGVSPSGLSPVNWVGFNGLLDLTGTLTFSGAVSGDVGVDVLDSQSGTTASLTGTVSLDGSYFSAANGAATTTPVSTVTFTPASSNEYTPTPTSPLTMTSAGSTAIYYTLTGLMPTTGSTVYSAPITAGGTTDFVVLAFAVNGSSQSRVSLRVYPGVGGS